MRKTILVLMLVAVFWATGASAQLTQYVNPFVGTDGYGNVYPGAQVPFGGIQISPDELGAGMYLYSLIVNGEEISTKRMILSK